MNSIEQIKKSDLWNDRSTENGKYLNNLCCPKCGENEAYAHKDKPNIIRCNRKNNCGAITDMTDKLPGQFANIENDNPPTPDDPHAPATAYLKLRGLNNSLDGLEYEYRRDIRNCGSGGVLFPIILPDGCNAWNGRIFNPPDKEGKSHNAGSVGEGYWKHPRYKYDPEEPTYVTEGVIDALSLFEMGRQAIAVLTSGKDPAKIDLIPCKKIVLAFDNDKAGKYATKKWSDYIEKTTGELPTAILPDKGDWNDFLLSVPYEDVMKAFEENMSGFEINASLARAKNGFDYAELLFEKNHHVGLFEFKGCYWFSFFDKKRKIRAGGVSNFVLRVIRFQKNTTILNRPEYTYQLEVRTKTGNVNEFTATAAELSTIYQMKILFMERCNALWKGDNEASTALQELITQSNAPEVFTVEITGYDLKSKCYIYNTHMIDTSGEMVLPDENGLFKISSNEYLLPPPHESICPSTDIDVRHIVELAFGAWGDRAVLAIAWVVAAFFVNTIKDKIGFFPFLSFYKESQAGKSYLTNLLNVFQCVKGEGLAMVSTNTSKGELRKFAQRSGMFTALLEWPTDKEKPPRFDLNQILTIYNKGSLQVRAIKSNDLRILETPFLGALMFVQNTEPFKKKPQKERVISLEFKVDQLTDKSRSAYNELEKISNEDKAAFYSCIMAERQWIESNWFEYYTDANDKLLSLELSSRIREIHALVLAFHNIVCRILELDYDLLPYLSDVASKKQKKCSEYEETVADRFFEKLFNCNTDIQQDCIRINDTELYIHLPNAEKGIKSDGHTFNWKDSELRDSLRNHPAFLKSNDTKRINNVIQKVWIFDKSKIDQDIPLA